MEWCQPEDCRSKSSIELLSQALMTICCSKIKQECLIIDFQSWRKVLFPILFPMNRRSRWHFSTEFSIRPYRNASLSGESLAWPGRTCRIDLCWAHSVSIGLYRRRWRKRMLFLWIELVQLDPIRDVSAQNVSGFHLGSLRQNWHLLQIIKGGLWYWETGFISFCHIQEKWLT